MPKWFRWLASLKLNTALLVFLVLVLGAGTIVESRLGTQAARAIYYAPWFQGLLALLGINIACSLWERWPWGKERIGFALTHASILIILLGGERLFPQIAPSLGMPLAFLLAAASGLLTGRDWKPMEAAAVL